MSHFSGFVRNICENCGLFCPDKAAVSELCNAEPSQKSSKIQHHRLEDLPGSHVADGLDEPLLSWDVPQCRFVFVSDCKPLVQVLNGYSPLASTSMLPLFHRVTNHLASLFEHGLLPNCRHLDPVIWRRREYNKKADYLVNYTMDRRQSWHQICKMPVPKLSLKQANFIAHFDGGTRGDDCSAAAWILEARFFHDGNLVETPIAFCGKFLCPAVSSFMSEAIALESCTDFLSRLVQKVFAAEPSHKRRRIG